MEEEGEGEGILLEKEKRVVDKKIINKKSLKEWKKESFESL